MFTIFGELNNIILCLAIFFSTFSQNLANLSYCMANIKGNSKIEITKSLIYLLSLILFVKTLGITGAIIATLIASLFTEAWYFPRFIIQKTKMNKFILIEIIKSIVINIGLATVLIVCFKLFFQSKSLISLSFESLFFTLILLALNYMLNRPIKQVMQEYYKLIFKKDNLTIQKSSCEK